MIPTAERDRLAVVARYDNHGGIEIEGASIELQRLSDILVSVDLESMCTLIIPESCDAAPYDGFLSSIHVLKRGQKARIARRGDAIRVEGSGAALGSLSQSIKFLANKADDGADREPLHMHVEPYEGHPYLESNSEPLTVVLRRSSQASDDLGRGASGHRAPRRLLDMDSSSERHLQRILEVIEVARKGDASLVNVADSLHFLLSSLEGVDQPWAEQFVSHVLTLESAGLASTEQKREMGEGFIALKTQTLDALEMMVKARMMD